MEWNGKKYVYNNGVEVLFGSLYRQIHSASTLWQYTVANGTFCVDNY